MKLILCKLLFFILMFGLSNLACNTFNTFKPTLIPDPPQECHDWYTLIHFTTKLTGAFSKSNTSVASALALVSLSYGDCKQARKELKKEAKERQERIGKELKKMEAERIRQECIKLIYGPKLLPKKGNYKKYADFLECQNK